MKNIANTLISNRKRLNYRALNDVAMPYVVPAKAGIQTFFIFFTQFFRMIFTKKTGSLPSQGRRRMPSKSAIIPRLIMLNLIVLSSNLQAAPTIKKASEVFKKWLSVQHLYERINLDKQSESITKQFFKNHRICFERNLHPLRTHFLPLLKTLTNEHINELGHQLSTNEDDIIKYRLKELYINAEYDITAFIKTLKNYSFPESYDQTPLDPQTTINSNLALGSFIFGQEDKVIQSDVLFSVANKFVKFCFSPETFPIFQHMLLDKQQHAVAKFLQSTTWNNLSSIGWSTWSKPSLRNIKQAADQGKKIIYIAGGSDIYQLITNGIYNITIIDPQLPSQPKYYTNDWAWIMQGTIGDQIIFEEQNIIMTRTNYKEDSKPFQAMLEKGQTISINPSITTWLIMDRTGKQLGSYTLERRFVEQTDFYVANDRALLMSFNELSFICSPEFLHGWRIEPSKFTNNLTIFIKQLHDPVSKEELCNMHTASILNATDFKFIPLGSCIN